MTYLYTKDGLDKIKKEKNINLILMILCCSLAATTIILFIVLSNYKNRVLFSIISSVICSLIVVFGIYFTAKFNYLRRVFQEYETLLNTKDELIDCEILECSKFITTLPDRSRCHEVLVKFNDKEAIFYLSELFDREEIKVGKCKIAISFDYLKGYQYED